MLWIFIIPVLTYFILLINTCRSLIAIRPYRPGPAPHLKLSVIVACKNEEKNLPFLLGDLNSQDYPQDFFEVIIVDDSSADNTFEFASSYNQIKGLRVIRNTGKGKKSAIRTGVETANNELIITTDADCRLSPGWIRTIASFYEENDPDMIIGPVMIKAGPGLFNRFQELEFLSLQGITAGTAITGNPVMCNGANLSFTVKAYREHSQNLHEEIASGDDVFFLHSLKKDPDAKIRWISSEESIVTTEPSDSPESFFRQRARWISKGRAYNDRFTILLASVTFVTALVQILLLTAGIFNTAFLPVFAVSYMVKSIPDIIILSETLQRYGKQALLKWFIPAQIIYPFYLVAAVISGITGKEKWR
jgi:biofilm PGA synthesis N-glycosyltransferase PgaC